MINPPIIPMNLQDSSGLKCSKFEIKDAMKRILALSSKLFRLINLLEIAEEIADTSIQREMKTNARNHLWTINWAVGLFNKFRNLPHLNSLNDVIEKAELFVNKAAEEIEEYEVAYLLDLYNNYFEEGKDEK